MSEESPKSGLRPALSIDDVLAIEPRLNEIANIESKTVADIDSTDMSPLFWIRLVDEIVNEYHNYSSFLIIMGTNTLAFAASALSFALASIGKPVIFTGSQIPATYIGTDARRNLVNALRVATLISAGVFVVFGTKVIRGCRAKKLSESTLNPFGSFQEADFGEIGIEISLRLNGGHPSAPFTPMNGFSDGLFSITLLPGMCASHLNALITSGVKGLVVRAFGSGDIPSDLLSSFEHARDRNIPVIVTTQCPVGATRMGLNLVGRRALETGVIQAFDMSIESMTTKLSWLLAQNTTFEMIKKRMHQNLVGEISEKGNVNE